MFSTALPGAAAALSAAMNDAWAALAMLDPTVRAAAIVLLAVEVAAVVAIRALSTRERSAAASPTPADRFDPSYSDAA